MKVILISKEVFWNPRTEQPYTGMVEALEKAKKSVERVVMVSNHSAPAFLSDYPVIEFFRCVRQRKDFLQNLSTLTGTKNPSDYIVFGATDIDFLMATNSNILLIGCNWSLEQGKAIKKYGLPFNFPAAIPTIMPLLSTKAPWFYQNKVGKVDVYALTQAGTHGETDAQMLKTIEKLRVCLKDGAKNGQKAFLLHLLSSVFVTDELKDVDYWEIWPGSDSSNDHTEVMDFFARHLRYTFKKRAADKPLFIRHKPAPKRHATGGDRTDPTDQLKTIHINPEFKGKIEGKTFVILDDYLTYGLSFGVSSTMLLKEGAKKIICLAMGKFGNQARRYTIPITASNLYKPFLNTGTASNVRMNGEHSTEATQDWVEKFRRIV